jgi:hypothetical protein
MGARCEQVDDGSGRKEVAGCASASERVLFSPGRLSLPRVLRLCLAERLSLPALPSRTMSTPSSAQRNAVQMGMAPGMFAAKSARLGSDGLAVPPTRLSDSQPVPRVLVQLCSHSRSHSLRLLGRSRLLASRTSARLATRAASMALAARSLRVIIKWAAKCCQAQSNMTVVMLVALLS